MSQKTTLTAAKTSAANAGPATSGDSPFPSWEAFIPHFVHPVKVAVVEALLCVGGPLSAAQLAKIFSGRGETFDEPNVRYHVRHLLEVGLLEVVQCDAFGGESRRAKFVYFTGQGPQEPDSTKV